MNLIVWGTGQEYTKHKHIIKNMKYRLIDSAEPKQGGCLDGIRIESPSILYEAAFDYIAIATALYFDEIYHKLVSEYSISDKKIFQLRDMEKELLMRDIGSYKIQSNSGPKIMFGYCFLIYENCRIHDYLLAQSLRIRGAEIIPVVCGGAQELQCSVYGGVWGNESYDIIEKEKKHIQNCRYCKKCDKDVWESWGNFDIVSAVDYVEEEEKKFTRSFVREQEIGSIAEWTFEYFPIGKWSLKTYYNNELISYKKVWDQKEENEIRSLAYNVMLMCIASLKIVNAVQPEIIYSNDSFYYPYSILETIARHKNIPFYNAYGIRKDTYSYAMDMPVINMQLDSAWETVSERPLTKEEGRFIEEYLDNRRYGKDMMINSADPFKSVKEISYHSVYGTIDSTKRTALLTTNVTWDAAALDKNIVYENIVQWVLDTIDLFAQKEEWQLIVKAHPVEVSRVTPEARERIVPIVLEKYQNVLPSNVVLIDADSPIKVYDFFEQIDLGIVYTTTVGLEMCCEGIPVITVAKAPYRNKGFTYDPIDVAEYKEKLHSLMCLKLDESEKKRIIQQAKKFFLLYYFIYMLPNPFHRFSYEGGAVMKIKSVDDILPGENEVLDYICESIQDKKAILSKDRFPPYKLEV